MIGQLVGAEPGAPLDAEQGFYDLGLDSLSLMQLRNRLQERLELSLPATLGFQHSNITALTAYLVERIQGSLPAVASQAETAALPADDRGAALDDLDAEAIAERLAEKLAALRGGKGGAHG
jgi:acyl carrier protein